MIAVGQATGHGAPDAGFVDRIQALLESERSLGKLSAATLDPRMTPAFWRNSLRFELLMLLKWSAERLIAVAKGISHNGSIAKAPAALVLLPRYGFALHALRRAVPFAALGMKSTVSVSENFERANADVSEIGRALGIGRLVRCSEIPAVDLVRRFAKNRLPIFMTGRRSTFDRIRASHADALIFGATGACSVVVACNAKSASAVEARLNAHRLSTSCSRHGLTVISDGLAEESRVRWMRDPLAPPSSGRLGAVLRAVHPSVVLTTAGRPAGPVPHHIAGYTVIECDPSGQPRSRQGFARDPCCGWPGDYCI